MAVVTIYFAAKMRLGAVQRRVLKLLAEKPMLIMDMSKSERRATDSLYFNGLITYWYNEWNQMGYQITDKGRKALEG